MKTSYLIYMLGATLIRVYWERVKIQTIPEFYNQNKVRKGK